MKNRHGRCTRTPPDCFLGVERMLLQASTWPSGSAAAATTSPSTSWRSMTRSAPTSSRSTCTSSALMPRSRGPRVSSSHATCRPRALLLHVLVTVPPIQLRVVRTDAWSRGSRKISSHANAARSYTIRHMSTFTPACTPYALKLSLRGPRLCPATCHLKHRALPFLAPDSQLTRWAPGHTYYQASHLQLHIALCAKNGVENGAPAPCFRAPRRQRPPRWTATCRPPSLIPRPPATPVLRDTTTRSC